MRIGYIAVIVNWFIWLTYDSSAIIGSSLSSSMARRRRTSEHVSVGAGSTVTQHEGVHVVVCLLVAMVRVSGRRGLKEKPKMLDKNCPLQTASVAKQRKATLKIIFFPLEISSEIIKEIQLAFILGHWTLPPLAASQPSHSYNTFSSYSSKYYIQSKKIGKNKIHNSMLP